MSHPSKHSCSPPDRTSSGVALQEANSWGGSATDVATATLRAAQSASTSRPALVAEANHLYGACRGGAEMRLRASAPTGDRSPRLTIGWKDVVKLPPPNAARVR